MKSKEKQFRMYFITKFVFIFFFLFVILQMQKTIII